MGILKHDDVYTVASFFHRHHSLLFIYLLLWRTISSVQMKRQNGIKNKGKSRRFRLVHFVQETCRSQGVQFLFLKCNFGVQNSYNVQPPPGRVVGLGGEIAPLKNKNCTPKESSTSGKNYFGVWDSYQQWIHTWVWTARKLNKLRTSVHTLDYASKSLRDHIAIIFRRWKWRTRRRKEIDIFHPQNETVPFYCCQADSRP